MTLDAFTARLGIDQARIARSDSQPGAGSHAFVLGSAHATRHELTPGDYVEVSQDVDLTDETLVRVAGLATVPDEGGFGPQWEVSLRVDDEARASLRIASGRSRDLGDLGANVSRDQGVHRLAVRLQFVQEAGR